MPNFALINHDADDFGDLPSYFAQWEVLLGHRNARMYSKLRDPWLDGKLVTFKLLGSAIGVSQTAAMNCMPVLESYGFLAQHQDENGQFTIEVHDVPELPASAESIQMMAAEIALTPKELADSLLGHWNELYRKEYKRPYQFTRGRDISLAKKLLSNGRLSDIRDVMRYYYDNLNDDDSRDFGVFYTRYNDAVSEMTEYERRRF